MNRLPFDWENLLSRPAAGTHFVQLYSNEASLFLQVARFAGMGLRHGDAVIVIAIDAHRRSLEPHLQSAAPQWQAALAKGQLIFMDADETLASFLRGEMPDWKAFDDQVGSVIRNAVQRFPKVRAYGEMVNVLWHQGRQEAAVRLEEFWNELGRCHSFSLLCSYALNSFDSQIYRGSLASICRTHSHCMPHEDPGRFENAVNRAIADLLEPDEVLRLRQSLKAQAQATVMSAAQSAVLWLHRHMPLLGDAVLERAQTYSQ